MLQPCNQLVSLADVFLPRPQIVDKPALSGPILTPSTVASLQGLGTALKSRTPILVSGQAGSGKSALIRYAATVLGKLDSMITLHLNEQSDAKTLIGIYTTGSTPGSFVWQPGVLTKAVMEGRWILIEDLERAPNEILSVLLPLIEKRELALPGRDQIVKAALGFRILATTRTLEDHKGKEYSPTTSLLGLRHWTQVKFQSPSLLELSSIISGSFPQIAAYTDMLVKTFEDLQNRQRHIRKSDSGRSATVRPISPRELFSWATRISSLVGKKTTIDRDIEDQILLSGLDCFAGFLPDGPSRNEYGHCIAQHVGIDPQRFNHLLSDRTISHKIQEQQVIIGSYHFPRPTVARSISARSKTFSMNRHTAQQVERIAAAVSSREPLLLVGETGTGKTTSIQYLADVLGKRLTPFNMSQQSESGDLLGGFKPISTRTIIIPLQDEFDHLFKTTFPTRALEKNQDFFDMLNRALSKQRWLSVCKCWDKAWHMFEDFRRSRSSSPPKRSTDDGAPLKKRKVAVSSDLQARWERFRTSAKDVEARLRSGADSAVAFSFVEGGVIKAAKEGDWILLDEINLASPDTLEALADLFDQSPTIMLSEAGSVQRIGVHPDFRIFAAMNPATDVGKKDLPLGIRSRFTEIYVDSPEKDLQSLQQIVQTYLGPSEVVLSETASRLHQEIQGLCDSGVLVDGAGQRPHFSLRTLTRVLLFARDIAGQCSLRRALHEGFSMSYLTMLDGASEQLVMPVIDKYIYGKNKKLMNELKVAMAKPAGIPDHELIPMAPYWLRKGSMEPVSQSHYIKTPSVQRNVDKLIRASMTRRFPILLQGPTSSGKTSMVEYLAKESGHEFVRINNHEHTDLQEYLGSYVSGQDGRLFFQEGLLVRAIREGHWIVLDELNLAPTDVLEALNRLLDDNRELLIPDTQEIVRPHPSFMLFATQNPAGIYGGRKMVSRAFRNRFMELHFDDIPVDELQTILVARSRKAPSWCELIVKVYKELSLIRQEGKIFEQKGFATLRDLFRWALRPADTAQDLANNGYMLLAERCRKPEERDEVKRVIEKVVGTKSYRLSIDPEALYNRLAASPSSSSVVWTKAMKRLYSLVSTAIANHEPVLLVGETGCGKTTVCQVIAEARKQQLHIVNAHQNTETGDLIGAQRPSRNKAAIEKRLAEMLNAFPNEAVRAALHTQGLQAALDLVNRIDVGQVNGHGDDLAAVRQAQGELKVLFEWSDGSLIEAMKKGELFLLDEISLADDSVLERLNSVLEPSRSILLAEKGTLDSFVVAADGFEFFATMNPGGDYGKKELSPALRNRFTEIWVPALSDDDDVLQVVGAKLRCERFASSMLTFARWFQQRYNAEAASSVHIRDLLAWADFMNNFNDDEQEVGFRHGAAMVYLDSLGANPSGMLAIDDRHVDAERKQCIMQLEIFSGIPCADLYSTMVDVAPTKVNASTSRSFFVSFLMSSLGSLDNAEFLSTPTIACNAVRVARALKLTKPILLEGAPGVGKTTLVSDMARCARVPLTRINLSEQTDLMDLFGSDVPIEGDGLATFAWRDAPFLRAMKRGEWVLLDEMNLASQSILEGLNACLDHRGEVYIPELNQTFHRHPDFKLFAAQNPHHQGGGRKGLPASFVNRFTVVYAEVLRQQDLLTLCQQTSEDIDVGTVTKVVDLIEKVNEGLQAGSIGSAGSPWELNLRDSKRWLELVSSPQRLLRAADTRHVMSTVIAQRFRTQRDQAHVLEWYRKIDNHFGDALRGMPHCLSSESFQVGFGLLARKPANKMTNTRLYENYDFQAHLDTLESVMLCMQKNWPVLLVGAAGCGKTKLIEQLASLVGASLTTFSINADIDSMDLVGGYEQHDPLRLVHETGELLKRLVRSLIIRDACSALPLSSLVGVWAVAQRLLANTKFPELTDLDQVRSFLQHCRIHDDDEFRHSLMRAVSAKLDQLHTNDSGASGARFEWLDGTLIRAMQKGEWLVLDNANLCSPAALDRLNSLLEPNGKLIINEHTEADGQARVVTPHPDFRIILTMDPKHGELSRALRNRCVELFMPDWKPDFDESSVFFHDAAVQRIDQIRNTLRLDSSAEYKTIAYDNLCRNDRQLLQLSRKIYGVDEITKDEPVLYFEVDSDLQSPPSLFEIDGTRVLATRHPLNNPLIYIAASTEDQKWNRYSRMYAEAIQFELAGHTFRMSETLRHMKNSAAPGRTTTRLLKSAADPSKDGVFKALAQLKHDLEQHFLSPEAVNTLTKSCLHGVKPTTFVRFPVNYGLVERALDSLCRLWWDLHYLASHSGISEAMLPLLGRYFLLVVNNDASCGREIANGPPIDPVFAACVENSVVMLGATAPRHASDAVVALWRSSRPSTPATREASEIVARLQNLLAEFHNTVKLGAVSLNDAVHLRMTLMKALEVSVSGDRPDQLHLSPVEQAINEVKLVSETISDPIDVKPHFTQAFDCLNRHLDLVQAEERSFASADNRLHESAHLLGGRPPGWPSITNDSNSISATLQHLINYCSSSDKGAGTGRISLSSQLLADLHGAATVPIQRIPLLKGEMLTMGKLLASNTHSLALERTNQLHLILQHVLEEILQYLALQDDSGTAAVAGKLLEHLDLNAPIPQRSGDRGSPSLHETAALVQGALSLGRSWINLALGCIALLVPSAPEDPALQMILARTIYNRHHKALEDEIHALKQFEQANGNGHPLRSMRLARLEFKLTDLEGTEPKEAEVWRCPNSNIEALFSVFRSVHEMFLPYTSCFLKQSPAVLPPIGQDTQLRRNIVTLKQRLMSNFPDFQDLTIPLVGFLSCLEIGLDLYSAALAASNNHDSFARLISVIPLAGAGNQPNSLEQLPQNWLSLIRQGVPALTVAESFSVSKSISPAAFDRANGFECVAELLSYVQMKWEQNLKKERAENATKSSLYRYTGVDSVEDEAAEEEFAEMFPDYDSNPTTASSDKKTNYRTQSSMFADQLASLFDANTDAKGKLINLLDTLSSATHFVDDTITAVIKPDTLLPLAIRQLDKQSTALTDVAHDGDKDYNVYTDPNIQQVQIMAALVSKIETRFRTIQKAWPEHATLADVLQTCRELVQFAHSEPLMKVVTKLEKLHDQIHEWQTVASKDFSAETVYNNVTDLIVSWRRLELSTWSRMLDQETRKCEDDAKAWFFVAFQSIVAGTFQFKDTTEGLHDYVLELLKTLDAFFRATGLGQYSTRLRIVEALQKLVESCDYLPHSSKDLLCNSTHNFLVYFKRFERPIHEALANGRKTLDADMKNVIQVASWKDTNILALRQSAKKSHSKLFKVIRKFRALLGQPVESIIATGIPAHHSPAVRSQVVVPVFKTVGADETQKVPTHSRLEQIVPNWQRLPARFRNVETTVNLITKLATVPGDKPAGSEEVMTWLADTQATAEMLRKSTPSLMTEEHKATAQHLKSRKRGLFADVLKSLRTMGFKSNLSTDVLAQQSSMVAVLTSSSKYMDKQAEQTEHNLHQLLHWMPQVRESGRQHSEDLTGAEVGRSTALIESMLQNIVVQREHVTQQLAKTASLEMVLQRMQNLSKVSNIARPSRHISRSVVGDGINALATLLEAAQELTSAHFRLAEEDGTEEIQELGRLAQGLRSMLGDWQKLPDLPEGLTCAEKQALHTKLQLQVDEVRQRVEQMIDDSPSLGPLLSQVLQWATHDSWTTSSGHESVISIQDFQQNVCGAIDHILAAIETVPKSLAGLPSSIESPAWLIQEARILNDTIDRLRLPETTAVVKSVLDSLHRISDAELSGAVHFLISLTSIFMEYHKTHSDLTSRLLSIHTSTTSLAATLAKLYVTLARDGFCSPKEKDNDPSAGKDNGVEAGTGLGDGEGAEDISKDIGDDEDLTELAQEKNEERQEGDVEDEKDAVDMADQDLEGEYGEEQEKADDEEGEGDEGEDREVESEAGSVDDLGEGTVDEKMWDDGGKEEDQKEQEAEKAEGTKSEDVAAAGEQKREKDEKTDGGEEGEEGEEEEQVGAEEEENQTGESKEAERADPTMQQEENLDLPDDIDMDGQEKNDDVDDDLDMLDEDGQETEEQSDPDNDNQQQDVDDEVGDEAPLRSENQELKDDEMDEETNEAGETAEEAEEPAEQDNVLQDNRPDDSTVADQVAPSDAQGTGLDEEQPQDEEDKQTQTGAAQRPKGAQGEDSEMQKTSGAQGERNEAEQQEAGGEDDQEQPMTAAEESFKKLGDAMEKWYKQRQRQIQDAQKREKDAEKKKAPDAEMEDVDFEHLSDEEDEGDTQALGAAREDEATAIDEEAGTAVNDQERTDQFTKDDQEQDRADNQDIEMHDADLEQQDQVDTSPAKDERKAFVGEYREPSSNNRDREASTTPSEPDPEPPVEESDQPTSSHLPSTDLSPPIDHPTALSTWQTHLSRTLPHSLHLQEQLRLILHPTSTSKLRGDFGTGKRLNIKRIIPYIASNYKRDKIWLRRSVPSKREYQIVIALDDSGSMAESGAGEMALDTVAMVGRALGVLEAGELSVVGFGKEVKVPVSFGEGLTVDKGAEVVRELRFGQAGTDVKALLGKAGDMFGEGRGRGGRRGAQTWQLMLVVGDGVFDDGEGVRRMERRLREEGVMVVFVIVDAEAGTKGRQSIVDLKRPRFWKDAEGGTQVEIARYIETFPFRYYLIVREVAELPGVLASALRQWFAEIAETG
ncbi:hypothetical protein KVT40_002921 [Elsinoe batatas]|uniref:Midasin n=1 Tax=Elsinoe batatas TaxID=2601811 RepID=A0A8K0PGK0_9PEZI|nr:hypothetical protein KVT40_002921 [Elsinoe batatas]